MRAATGLLDIDLAAIAENYRRLVRLAPGATLAPAVKADAYGLGVAAVAPALAAAGARDFFVASLDEALTLRALLPAARILVLNGLLPGEESDLVAAGLLPVLNSPEQVAAWRVAARAAGRALPCALHLDSGINRLGLAPAEVERLAEAPDALEGLAVALVMTHLACADEPAHPANEEQRRRFEAMVERLPDAARQAPRSIAASAGLFLGPAYHADVIRPGYALYGGNPTPGRPNPMRTVVRLMARILQLRRVDSPDRVGYGASHSVRGPSLLATLAVGYADGFLRSLSGRGRLVVAGQAVPVVGRVSMDLTVVDVTSLDPGTIAPGGFVEVLGDARDLDGLAAEAGTIGYELLTALGRRHTRSYRS